MAAIGTPIDRIIRLPPAARAGIAGGAALLVVIAYAFVFYFPLSSDIERLQRQQRDLSDEKRQYEEKRQNYLAFRTEVQRLLETQKDLIKVLPKTEEIPGFLTAIHAQADLVGVEVLKFERREEQPQDFFARIPVEMAIQGPFHRIARFFRNVGDLRRIVNIADLELKPVAKAQNPREPVEMRAAFSAYTFRFLDKDEAAGAPAPAAGGH